MKKMIAVLVIWTILNQTHIFAQETSLFVKHYVHGKNILVECVVTNFTFAKDGRITVYVDGEKSTDIHTAAFIVKGLKNGKHHIRLELAKNNGELYGVKKEFDVEVKS